MIKNQRYILINQEREREEEQQEVEG